MRSTPTRYYVTPRLYVDEAKGDLIPTSDAVTLIEAGCKVIVPTENAARNILAEFKMSPDEIDSAIRFGQTGRT